MKKRDNILRLKYRLTTILIMIIIFGCTNQKQKEPHYTISYSAGNGYYSDYTDLYRLDHGCVYYNGKTRCGDFEIKNNW